MTSAEKLASKVESFSEDLDDNIEEGLEDGMGQTKDDTKQNIRQNDSIANAKSGNGMLNSVTLDRDTIPTFHHSASVRVNKRHAPFVEYGTGSNQRGGPLKFPAPSPRPPLGPIKQWMLLKGITRGQPYKGLRKINPKTGERDQQTELTWLARAIADQIGKYGNRPHPFARPAARTGFDATVDEVKAQMYKSVRRF